MAKSQWPVVMDKLSSSGRGGYCFQVGMDGHSFQVGT
jgi:hypothetical protein